jgi:TonB family protein
LRTALVTAALACGVLTFAQTPATPPPATPPSTDPPADTQQAAPVQPATPDAQQQAPAATPAPGPAQPAVAEPVKADDKDSTLTAEELREAAATEDQLTRKLVGKTFYLRGGYLDNNLHFNEKGELDGSSPKASYTLSLVQIDKVKVDKHHVDLEGVRYGLHFLGALANEDQAANVDRVQLTSKKKPFKITIEREIVVVPKKPKPGKDEKKAGKKSADKKPAPTTAAGSAPAAPTMTDSGASTASATPPQQPSASPAGPAVPVEEPKRHGVTVTTSPAEAARTLGTALESIFSPGIDDRMIATLPDYWRLYYKAVADKADYRPTDPAILHVSQVDKKPQLTKAFEAPSNEYAQNNGVAGMAMYHVIVGPDGKPGEIAVGRPIGFGLDENAVDSIRKATFDPGMKDGKPVTVEVDLTVQFRIYSKRTAAVTDAARVDDKGPKLPGPYSVGLPQPPQPAPQPQQ